MIPARPPCAWGVQACKQGEKIKADEKSGHHNSHSVSARPSLACSRLSVGEGDLASAHG
jgi:hypothetical protein